MQSGKYFISYSRKDSAFVKKLAIDLKKSGEDVWLDQLDIAAGIPWDECIQNALNEAEGLIVILSNAFVKSGNVMDEVSYAISKGKKIFPLMIETCAIPFRLARLQYLDFTGDYESSFERLLAALNTSEADNLQPTHEEVKASSTAEPKKVSIKRNVVLPLIIIIVAFVIGFVLFKNSKGSNDLTPTTQKNSNTEQSANTNPSTITAKGEEASSQNIIEITPLKKNRTNLFATDSGTEILVASSDDWKYSIDNKEDEFRFYKGDEVVYGFKDGKAATFDTFNMLIVATAPLNVKDFELFAGNDKPLGPFQSIGKFQTQNAKLFKTPYQEFTFPATTAKYFKVRIVSSFSEAGYGYCREFQLFGKL